ncbi:MAG: hypothetical protein IJH87_01350, partial [Atopobiaceae bacterium]|nr:hypothetical protein [Atopobiaceae bacterium]
MKKEIVVIGAGKIGRGSLGLFFTRAGWKVDFFGHNPVKMAELAAQGYYETRTETGVTSRVEGFEVLDCSTDEALIEKLREVDLCACALYANAFADVGVYLAKATKARMADGNEEPLNVMLCMNDPTAIDQIEASMNPLLTEEEQAWRREHIALCFTITLSNGSLPLPDDNPWLVLVSDYPSLQIDEGPWLGEKLENIPPILYTTNGKA